MLSQPCGSEARKASRTWRRPGPGAEAAAAQGPARPTQSRGGVSGEGAAADLARAPAHPQAGPQRLSGRDPGSLTAPLRGVRVASAPCPGSLSSACSGCVSCVMVTMTNPQQPREGQAACAGALLPAALRPAEGVPWGGGGGLSGPWSSLPSAQPAVHKHKRMNAVRRPVYQYIWLILAAVTGNPATRLHPKGRPLRCTTRQSRTLAPGSQTRRPLRWGETRTRPPPHSALTGPFTAAFFPSCCLPAPGSRGWGRAGATAGTGSGLSSWMVAHQQNQNVSHTGSTLDKSGRPTGGRSSDHQVAAVGWAVPGPGTARPNASDKTKPAVGRGWTVRAEKD